jgi:hypothetical protein
VEPIAQPVELRACGQAVHLDVGQLDALHKALEGAYRPFAREAVAVDLGLPPDRLDNADCDDFERRRPRCR